MSTASEKARAEAAVKALSLLGNKIAGFRGASGLVDAVGYIDRENADFGIAPAISDARWVATLVADGLGEVYPGNEVIDEDGGEWVMLEELPESDNYVIDWAVQQK